MKDKGNVPEISYEIRVLQEHCAGEGHDLQEEKCKQTQSPSSGFCPQQLKMTTFIKYLSKF